MKAAVVFTHGCEGAEPTPDGLARLRTAFALWLEGHVDVILITGGLLEGTLGTLAHRYGETLKTWGVPSERIALEEESRDTAESIRLLLSRLERWEWPTVDTLVVVSSPLHLRRILALLKVIPLPKRYLVEYVPSPWRAGRLERVREALLRLYGHFDPRWERTLARWNRTHREESHASRR